MSRPDIPLGPVLLRPGSTPVRRRRRRIFLAIFAVVFAALLWPIHAAVAARVFPLVLGLPFSFFWVVLLLSVQFFALLWLFLGEKDEPERRPGPAGPGADEPLAGGKDSGVGEI